jgi:hypothetical protein
MRRRLELDPAALSPTVGAVLARQGVPRKAVSARVAALAAEAVRLVHERARPVAVELDVDDGLLAAVLAGEDVKAPDTPLDRVRPKARRLALFAATLGEAASALPGELFARDDYALAAMVDAAASLAAERAVTLVEESFALRLLAEGVPAEACWVLSYAPGYCGWRTLGLRPLFALLQPADVGLALGASCLMHPLKSCAGVLAAGPREAHRVDPEWDFCRGCADPSCRRRQHELERRANPGGR